MSWQPSKQSNSSFTRTSGPVLRPLVRLKLLQVCTKWNDDDDRLQKPGRTCELHFFFYLLPAEIWGRIRSWFHGEKVDLVAVNWNIWLSECLQVLICSEGDDSDNQRKGNLWNYCATISLQSLPGETNRIRSTGDLMGTRSTQRGRVKSCRKKIKKKYKKITATTNTQQLDYCWLRFTSDKHQKTKTPD